MQTVRDATSRPSGYPSHSAYGLVNAKREARTLEHKYTRMLTRLQ